MNPDTVTTGQLISSFTARHWQLTITTIVTTLIAVGSGGFWLGGIVSESQLAVQQAELRSTLIQSQAKLEISNSRVEQLTATISQWQAAHQELQAEVNQRQQDISTLTAQLGQSNNCNFIHEQIIATQHQIANSGSIMVFDSSDEFKSKEREEIAALRQRLATYQQQLSSCNK